MNKFSLKKAVPHIIAVLVFILVSFIYFSPVLTDHKQLNQSDMGQFAGMSKSLDDYEKISGERSEWTNSMFSGMPSYQLEKDNSYNILESIYKPLALGSYKLSAGIFFLMALGFYVFMCCMGVNPWISVFAGLIYALGSYNIIIIGVGHITKAWAMSMIAPILAGMILIFKKKYVRGLALFALALALQISFNHIQITYYTLIVAVILGISYLFFAIKEKDLKCYVLALAIMIVGTGIALMPSLSHILVNQEYVKHTMRGGSELSVHPQGENVQTNDKGLDINYAYSWSYGKAETMTLLIPDYKGGGSNDIRRVRDNTITVNRMKALQTSQAQTQDQNQAQQAAGMYLQSSYYGTQPFTAGPVYFGSIVVFLSLLGFLIVENKNRWWLLAATIVSILLCWGNNFIVLNEWLFYHLPFYNKFRTPSMSLVIANVTMVIAAFLGLKAFLESENEKKRKLSLYISAGVTLSITLLCAIAPNMFTDFSSAKDETFAQVLGPDFVSALIADRQEMFTHDALRSFIFIAIAFLTLFLYMRRNWKSYQKVVICVIGIAAVADLWAIDKRYVNDEESYQTKYEALPNPSKAESDIMDLVSKEKPSHYRVYNMAVNSFNEASTSYFLPSIGGYSAAKLQRYQDIIDWYFTNTSYKQKDLNDTALLAHNPLRQFYLQASTMRGFPMPNMGVLNMLNTKYVIVNPEAYVPNTEACGAAWLVDKIQWVDNADQEIAALDNFDPKKIVVIDKQFKSAVKEVKPDPKATIEFVCTDTDNPTRREYNFNSSSAQLAVFSEIYYKDSWKAYIDGKEAEYVRANYVLRAMYIPAGRHKIEFVCHSDKIAKGKIINLTGSVLLVLLLLAAIFQPLWEKKINKKKLCLTNKR